MFGAVHIAGIITGTVAKDSWPSLMQNFGFSLPALREGHLYDLWVGLLFASRPGVHVTMLGMLLLGVGTLEYRRGTKSALVGFLLLGPVASIITMLILWPFDVFGIAGVKPYLYPPDMGSSSASMVCWGLFLGAETGLWRNLMLGATILTLALLMAFSTQAFGADHMVAFLFGLLVSVALIRTRLWYYKSNHKDGEYSSDG